MIVNYHNTKIRNFSNLTIGTLRVNPKHVSFGNYNKHSPEYKYITNLQAVWLIGMRILSK